MHSIDELLAIARQQHPALRAASAEVQAMQARRDTFRHAWGPSVTLVSGINREARHGAFAADGPVTAASIGIRITIPLYDGGDRRYRTAAANALVEAERARLAEAERRVAMEVWQNYQALRALSARRAVEQRLLADARRSFEMARGRYREGAGSMEALVTAQTALADAEHVIVASRARWQTARLRLAISIGQLDVRVPGTTLDSGFSGNPSPSSNSSATPSPGIGADFRPTPPAFQPLPDRENETDGRRPNTPR
ncbi:TolC family protein [Pandoraea norimbergensis]|uniref:TolC family protein n=1 Tax=Pandoraea norimbergensis TaxID=93219 RepID=UPI001EED69E2|nr:TolC family protein [Pandoraea norimbergensis]